ncbi:MAG: hypothetical protein JSS76_15350 [Bacteroidetes bacterium]|nr:hypothetical protein [Bacteroidota bacterium]
MPQKLSSLLADILRRANLDPADPRFADMLSLNTEVSDDIHNDITQALSGMMTTEEARSNTDLQRHFRQQSLNPVDTEIERWLDELNAPDDIRAEIAGQKNSYTRLRRILEKTRELEAQKATTSNASEKRKIQQQIDDLTVQLSTAQQQADERVSLVQKESDQRLTDFALRSALHSRKYANTRLSPEENSNDARALLEAYLLHKGAALRLDNNTQTLRLMSASTPDQPYQEGGRMIDFNDFLDSSLASKGVLQINDPVTPRPSGTTTFLTNIPAQGRIPASNIRAIAEMTER